MANKNLNTPNYEIVNNGETLRIELPLSKKPKDSKSGKSLILATTSGFTSTGLDYDGSDISVSVNVTIPKVD